MTIQGFTNEPAYVKIDSSVGLGQEEIPISGNESSIAYGGLLATVSGTAWWVPLEKVLYIRQPQPADPTPVEPTPVNPGNPGAPTPPPAD